jgi:hypothetical protein
MGVFHQIREVFFRVSLSVLPTALADDVQALITLTDRQGTLNSRNDALVQISGLRMV